MEKITKTAETSVEIHPLLKERWSPRGFDPNKEVSEEDITSLTEAIRWAPSAGNSQPWRIIIGDKFKNKDNWDKLLECLEIGNKIWCEHVPLLFAMGHSTLNAKGNPVAYGMHDVGQAASHMTFQAESLGLKVHQMAGILPDKIKEQFDFKDANVTFVTMIAIGYLGNTDLLNDELKARETSARKRLSLEEIILSK